MGKVTGFNKEMIELKSRTYEGSGEKLILLHGFGGNPMEWETVAQDLARQYDVYNINLKPLFTSTKELSFSKQIEIIAFKINQIVDDHDKFHLVGTSYGGTLSKALAQVYGTQLLSHIMVNPMPMNPLKHLKNPLLRLVLFLSTISRGLPLFMMTPWGKNSMTHLGKVFRMGLVGNRHIKRFNPRKLFFIKKALSRFLWIAKNEDWKKWSEKTEVASVPRLIIAGSQDALFSPGCYKQICLCWNAGGPVFIQGGGHMIIKTHPNKVSELICEFLESSKSARNKSA